MSQSQSQSQSLPDLFENEEERNRPLQIIKSRTKEELEQLLENFMLEHEFSFLDEKMQKRILSVMATLKLSKFTMAKHLSIIRHCVG